MAIIGALDLLFRGDTSELDKAFGRVTTRARQTKRDVDSLDIFAKLKISGTGALTELAKGLAAPIAGFMALHSIISNVTSQMDRMAALSKSAGHLGMDVGHLQSLQGAFSKAGLSPDAVLPTLGRLQEHVAEAVQNPGSEGAASLKELRLSPQQLSGMSGEEQFKKTIDSLAQIQNVGERTRLAMQLFGREAGMEIATGFAHGSKAIDEAREKLERFGLLLSTENAAKVAQAKKAVDDYGLAWQGVWQGITVRYSGDIQAAFSLMTDSLLGAKDATGGWVDALDPVDGLLGGVVDLAGDIYTLFKDVQSEVTGLIASIMKLVGTLYSIPKSTYDLFAGNKQHGNNFLLDASKDMERLADQQDKEARDNDATPWSQRLKKRKEDIASGKHPGVGGGAGAPIQPVKDWTTSINDLLIKLREEDATTGKTAAQKQLYELQTKHATDAQIAEARALSESIAAKQTALKLNEADSVIEAAKSIVEYNRALDHGTITGKQYQDAMRGIGDELSGQKDRFAEYAATMDRLNRGRGMMSDTQYGRAAQAAKEQLTGIKDPLAEFNSKLADLDKLVSRKVRAIDFAQYHDQLQKLKHDILGIAETPTDRLREYNTELARLADLWRKGKMSAEEYRASAAAAQGKLGISLSPQQQVAQYKDARAALDKWAEQNHVSHDSQQYKDAVKAIAPQFVEGLKESTQTPIEKYFEGMSRLNEWRKAGLSDTLYTRGMQQLQQQMGLGEHRLAGAAEYGSSEARESIIRNRLGNDATNPQVQIAALNQQQLQVQKESAANLKKIADAQAGRVVMQLP
jgi:hypothetical protein